MRKTSTLKNSHTAIVLKKRAKILLSTAVALFALCLSNKSYAIVPIVLSNAGNSICTNYAPSGPSPLWTSLSEISIEEAFDDQFGDNAVGAFVISFTIDAPAGWEFNTSVAPTIFSNMQNLDGGYIITSFSSSSLTIDASGTGNDKTDFISINDLQVRPTTTTSVGGDIIITSFTNIPGLVVGDIVGTITEVAPVTGTASVLTGVSPTSAICAGTNVTFSATPTNGGTTPSYQWRLNATDISGATNDTYSSSTLDDGNTIECVMIGYSCITSPNATSATTTMTVNPLPTAVSGAANVCIGSTTTLTSTPTTGTWMSDNTGIAVIGSTTGIVSGISAGTANVTYELPTGCVTTIEVTVNSLPTASLGTMEVCMGSIEALSNGSGAGTWSSSNTAIADVDITSGVVSGIAAGTANVTYTLTTGCTTFNEVTVNALPELYMVTGTGSYCAGGSGVLVGLGGSETGTTYSLYNGSSLITSAVGTGSAISFGSNTTAATYTVTAINSDGCENNMSGSATVTITPLVTPAVVIVSDMGDTVCNGTSVRFATTNTNGGLAPGYAWSVNGASVAMTDTFTYTPNNDDTIGVVLTSNAVCPSPDTAANELIMVVLDNETPSVNITVSEDTVCQFSPVTVSVTSWVNGGSSPTFTWYKGTTSTTVTGTTYTYIPENGDVITVNLNSNYRCLTTNDVSSSNITMRVDTIFVPVVAIATNTGLSINNGDSVIFTATVTNGGMAPTYQWLKNSTMIAGATGMTFATATLANNDSISCVVSGTGDCSEYSFNSVKMSVGTGFENTTKQADFISLSPNPNNGNFNLSGTVSNDVTLMVTNMIGQTVYTGSVHADAGKINAQVQLNNNLPGGMYILTVNAGTENQVLRFVISK